MQSTKGTMELNELNVPGLNALNVKMNIFGEDDKLDIDFSSTTQITKKSKKAICSGYLKERAGIICNTSCRVQAWRILFKKVLQEKVDGGTSTTH